MDIQDLAATANAMVAPGKGILAADESTGTMTKRLQAVGVESTEDSRRRWRQLLFTSERIGNWISGVILYDETIRQATDDGVSFVDVLEAQGVFPGIKVDTGAKPLAGAPGELVTEGLDGLRERLAEYRELGARFTKWRAVISIGDGKPSPYCISVNAHALARYAALAQEAGLVPIVEPEVLMDGSHSIERCFEVTEATLHAVFAELYAQRVRLEGIVLKPNMVLSGKDASNRATPDEVAEASIACYRRSVPAAVPGLAFLSGGQTDEEATLNLDALNRRADGLPWQLSFSYGRGLQATPLQIWVGERANVPKAQEAFQLRARETAAARRGEYADAVSAGV
jgi:fructose-bisphosphate aldolase class I